MTFKPRQAGAYGMSHPPSRPGTRRERRLKPLNKQINETRELVFAESVNSSLPDRFRKVYYHLYTNGRASRAESILEDLSLLLLSKLAIEIGKNREPYDLFLSGRATANQALLPILQEQFPKLLDGDQKFALGDVGLRAAAREIADLHLLHSPAHALGEAFQAVIGPRLRGEKGQFFTPRSVVRCMVEILDPQKGEVVLDPACGTGGFLSETVIYQRERSKSRGDVSTLVGVDKDRGLARFAAATLMAFAPGKSLVDDFSSLDLDSWAASLPHLGESTIDVILTNPPFGAKIGVDDPRILSTLDFGYVWERAKDGSEWTRSDRLRDSEDPQVLFLEMCVRLLKPGGRMGIVLPEGIFGNRSTAYVWQWLRERGEIYGLIDCPRTTFQPGTDTKTNVLFFRKNGKKAPKKSATESVRIAVAVHCGHDRRGRSVNALGQPLEDDFPEIASSFREEKSEQWFNADIKNTDYLVPRYYQTPEVEDDFESKITEGARTVTLGELVEAGVISIKKGHEVGSEAYGTGDVPFVRTSDISNFEISTDPTKSVSEEIYDRYASQQALSPGDLLMVVDGRYRIGTTAMLTGSNTKCVAQSHLRIISVLDRSEMDPYALLFALNLPSVKVRLRNLVFIQSTLGTLGSRILQLRIPVLQGDGPWTDRLNRFKDALTERDKLLSELSSMSAPDVEL